MPNGGKCEDARRGERMEVGRPKKIPQAMGGQAPGDQSELVMHAKEP